jgi:hypothetical protein
MCEEKECEQIRTFEFSRRHRAQERGQPHWRALLVPAEGRQRTRATWRTLLMLRALQLSRAYPRCCMKCTDLALTNTVRHIFTYLVA